MRLIEKRTEPATVRDTRLARTTNLATTAAARAAFDQLDKQAVRDQLAAEQGQLCAFCMRTIAPAAREGRPVTMRIAHRTPIDVVPALALTWQNLLGSCDGGERSSGQLRTCDLSQGSAPLNVDPISPASMAKIRYELRAPKAGLFITSDDPDVRADVDQRPRPDGAMAHGVLALNTGDLPELRQQAWKAFVDQCPRPYQGMFGKPAWRAYFAKWRAQRGERLPPMLGVIEAKIG